MKSRAILPLLPLGLALGLFLLLGAYQLDLPGLHYDEAKEAGLNAMQLVTGQPVTAFRDATLGIGRAQIPLMVQDYIGALNVMLALPFLAVGGVNVVALRWLPLVIAALTLVLTWRCAWNLGGPAAGGAAALLLAVNPAFVFWSRQGIFVTNITALLFVASLLTGLRWWRARRPADLWLTAFLWGLGLYAKLLFVWAIGAMVLSAGGAWLLSALMGRIKGRRGSSAEASSTGTPPVSGRRWTVLARAAAAFLLPLTPLILFNLRTGGTLISIFGNLGRSYYGVDNSAYLANLSSRLEQVVALLRADYFWYLGGPYSVPWMPGLALGAVAVALAAWALAYGRGERKPLTLLLPLTLLALMVAQSAFTVSDLFITHYALLLPLIPLTGGVALATAWRQGRTGVLTTLATLIAVAWVGGSAWTTVRYHQTLTASGGYATHSDAINRLAAYLDEQGYAAPVALDWGIDAPVRFLTAGRVSPIEVFGYDRLDAPDDGFATRVAPLLQDSDTVYIGHRPERAVFGGRVEAMAELAAGEKRLWLQEAWFSDRSGEVLFVIYRSLPGG